MTKRAGKKKHRMGSQRHPPGPTQRPDTLIEDGLNKQESLSLELQALAGGWLQDESFKQKRRELIDKLCRFAEESDDPKTVARIVEVVVKAEQRAVDLKIKASGINQGAKQIVVVANGGEGSDKISQFVSALSAQQQQDFLDRYGKGQTLVLSPDS